jgi:hypothetical protein
MQFNKKFSDNLVLNHTETTNFNHEDGILYVMFYFSFYGQEFSAGVSKKYIDLDFPSIESEGPSELFDSFNSLLEDDYWDELKLCYEEHCKNEMEEDSI